MVFVKRHGDFAGDTDTRLVLVHKNKMNTTMGAEITKK